MSTEVNGSEVHSRESPSKDDVIDLKGEIPVDDITESDEGLLLDSDNEENKKGQSSPTENDYRYDDDGELDYDELMDPDVHAKEVEDEDEVKVHAIEDIEEGEVSSDEEGEIKESDDEETKEPSEPKPDQANTTIKPHPPSVSHSDDEPALDSPAIRSTDKEIADQKPPKKKRAKREDKSDGSDSEDGSHSSSNEDKDERSGDHVERDGMARGKNESLDKVPTPCRHFIGGKCSWGNNCRFLHEDPSTMKERPKPPVHDRMGGGPPDFHGGPLDGPWGIPRGFPPGGSGGPPFMHGPRPMGHPRDMPLHMDPIGQRGPMPLPPHGRPGGGFGVPHPMHGTPPFIPMHSRELPPGRPFDPVSRGGMGRGPEGRMGRGPGYPQYPAGNRKSGKIAEVTEETDGWMRLRTVTQDWSSDEEKGGRVEGDLRDRLKVRRGRDDSDSDQERRAHGKARPEDWVDPWARDVRGGKDKIGSKGKSKRKKASSSDDSTPNSDDDSPARRKKEKMKAKKRLSGSGRKGHKRSESKSSEESGSSDNDDRSSKKKKSKKSTPSTKSKKHREEVSSPESDSNTHSPSEENKRKRKQKEGVKKRNKRSKDGESSEGEEEGRKRRKGRHAISLTEDPRRFGMRDDFYPHPHFPPHLHPEERRNWPPHPHHPHTPFEDQRMFPPGGHPPREHPSHFTPETDRFGRDISKRVEYEDTRRHRRNDRPLPPHFPREGGFHDDFPPPPHQREPPGGPWDPRGRPPPFHDGRLGFKRRRSSEDISRSPTPPANFESESAESSDVEEKSRSQKHRSGSGHRHHSSEGRGQRGRHGKEKNKSSKHSKSSDTEKTKSTLSRKEKLLQELEAINKVIEKKKSKKRAH